MGGRVPSLNQSAAVFQTENVYTSPIFKNIHHIIGQITQKNIYTSSDIQQLNILLEATLPEGYIKQNPIPL